MGLVVVGLASLAVLGLDRKHVAASLTSGLGMLPFCQTGGVELTDEQCNASSVCKKKTARLAWSRAGATVFEGDGQSEAEVGPLSDRALRDLLDELSTMDPRDSDAGEIECGGWANCPPKGAGSGTSQTVRACAPAAS